MSSDNPQPILRSENILSQIRAPRVFACRRISELKMFDDKSHAEIFNQYRRRLFGIAYRMLGTSADAEDIVQEAYLALVQHKDRRNRNARRHGWSQS
jgi:hypothetical protein